MEKSIILFLLLSAFSFGQEKEDNYFGRKSGQTSQNSNSIREYRLVDEEAVFVGGGSLTVFLMNNLIYPEDASNKGIQGRVKVLFVVEKDGEVSGVKIEGEKLGYGLEEEAIRVIKKTSGKWRPAKVNGKDVRSFFRVPIIFKLLEPEEKVIIPYRRDSE